MENLPWLKQRITELKAQNRKGQVEKYTYEGQDIIGIREWIQSCYPCALYTCEGLVLDQHRDSLVFTNFIQHINTVKPIGEF